MPTFCDVGWARNPHLCSFVLIPHVGSEVRIGGWCPDPSVFVVWSKLSHVYRKEGLQVSPDSRDVGNSSSHREEIPNRRVWSQVLLPDVGLLNMLQEGFLVVEVTSSSGSGGPHGSNCVVNGELVVHEDGLWLVAPRSPGVYLLEQVAVEGRRFSRKESIEEGEVPAVREEAMDCEELMEEIRYRRLPNAPRPPYDLRSSLVEDVSEAI